METIFSKIVRGEIPCHKVYEDGYVLSFLDIFPLSRGHTLVIPKRAVATLDQLPDDDAGAIGHALPRICRAIMKATGCTAYNVLQNNGTLAHQAVFHVHFHIIPKYQDNGGLGITWPAGKLDSEQAQQLAANIHNALK